MKKLVTILLVVACFSSSAQSLLDSLSSRTFALDDSTGFILAEIALDNPAVLAMEKQVEAGKYELTATKGAWLNNLSASFNLNEISLKNNSTTAQAGNFYPRYNFNLLVPVGLFFTQGSKVKKARSEYEELKERKNIEVNKLRMAVLQAYQTYQLNKYLLALEETVVQDELVAYNQILEKFKNSELSLQAFTDASNRYNAELGKRVTLMSKLNNSRIELEMLIGMPLSTAMERVAMIRGGKRIVK